MRATLLVMCATVNPLLTIGTSLRRLSSHPTNSPCDRPRERRARRRTCPGQPSRPGGNMALDGGLEEATIPPGRELGPVAVVTCADATWLPVRPAPANSRSGITHVSRANADA